ncbi:MAG: phage major capsid protein [Enterobacterales bacterium]|nr:phage major capsid protein [Enterobacterales bacterium]
MNSQVNQVAEQIEGIADNLKTKFDSVEIKQRELSDRLLSVEQFGTNNSQCDLISANGKGFSFSREIKNSDAVQDFIGRKSKSAGIPIDAKSLLLDITNSTTTSTGATNPTQRLPGIVGNPEQRSFLRQFIMSIPATGSSFTYSKVATEANNAAPQNGEGVLKAESGITFQEVTEQIPTFAHWLKLSRQVMNDNPAIVNFHMQWLRYGLELKIENAIINGDGTASTMNGLLKAGNHTVYAPTVGDTAVDSVRKGILALNNSNFNAGLTIMNHNDVADIELLKDIDNNYIVGKPVDGGLSTLWGTPLYSTKALAAGTFITLDTEQAVSLHLREDALLEFSNSDGADFTKNLVTALAETRLGFAVHLPAGVISGPLV